MKSSNLPHGSSTQGCLHEVSSYQRAIASIRAHPTPLRSVNEAKELKNIGNYLANKIHSILVKRGLLVLKEPVACTRALLTTVSHDEEKRSIRNHALKTLKRSIRDYIPAYRKQPWYILLALQEAQAMNQDSAVSSKVLLQRIVLAGYTGNWSKLRTCLSSLSGTTYNLVDRSDTGDYYLTKKGQISAKLCPGSLSKSWPNPVASPAIDVFKSTSGKSSKPSSLTSELITRQCLSNPERTCIVVNDSDDNEVLENGMLEPEPETEVNRKDAAVFATDLIRERDSWELVLLLDHREIIERRNPRIIERKLLEQSVNCEVRALAVGDVQWIARRYRIDGETEEFMMNVIVERKEVHDLSGSIVDRRFFEQKTRLATVRENCGDMHVIYLIEGSLTQMTTVRTSGLNTAMGRIQVQDNFYVQQCQNTDETVTFLARVHARLLSKFPSKSRSAKIASSHLLSRSGSNMDEFARIFCLPPQTYISFNTQFRRKNQFTVREIFQQMLLQAPGLSAAKTVGLSAKYQNFRELEDALRKRGPDSEVEHVQYGKSQRRLGTKTRRYLCDLLTSSGYTDKM
ncbi:unnamed protein product [Peronospora belbahrii]|uniref:Crossover junction endonuclease MUS81 n=1 Tax=Peronospora belbahrii TaxID=622444 RepID=A0ABN8CPU1_9STRA|nr:unnamed protein product [Peronospora belbahrii]